MNINEIDVPLMCLRDGHLRSVPIRSARGARMFPGCQFSDGSSECLRCIDSINQKLYEGVDLMDVTEENPLRP